MTCSYVCSDDTGLVLEILEELAQPSACVAIQGWDQAGQLYYEYLRVSSQMSRLEDSADGYLVQQLQSSVEKLADRIHHLPCNSPSEM